MRYFMDTHDKTKGSFPAEEPTEEQFFAQFDALEEAAHELDVFGHAPQVSLREGKAFCFMSGPDESVGDMKPPSRSFSFSTPPQGGLADEPSPGRVKGTLAGRGAAPPRDAGAAK